MNNSEPIISIEWYDSGQVSATTLPSPETMYLRDIVRCYWEVRLEPADIPHIQDEHIREIAMRSLGRPGYCFVWPQDA